MRAGRLRERIEIQQATETPDGDYGDPESRWTTFARRWARVVPTSGGESFTDGRRLALQSHRFELRYLAAVTPKMRIVWNHRTFDILTVMDIDGRHREMHIEAEEVAA